MRLRLDRERCTGHGRCYDLAPALFDADDDGFGVVAAPEGIVPEGAEDLARKAATNCPEHAISVEG